LITDPNINKIHNLNVIYDTNIYNYSVPNSKNNNIKNNNIKKKV